jgi:hypothetical protein
MDVAYPDTTLLFACRRLPISRKASSVRIAGDSLVIERRPITLEDVDRAKLIFDGYIRVKAQRAFQEEVVKLQKPTASVPNISGRGCEFSEHHCGDSGIGRADPSVLGDRAEEWRCSGVSS